MSSLKQEFDQKKWQKVGTRTYRQYLAEKNPLAWVLEYEPLILLPNVGEIPFRPYWAQQCMLHDQSVNRSLNKMRQGGFSTAFSAAESVWKMLYRPSPSIAVLSKNEDDAKGFLSKFYLAYDSVKDKDPNWKKLSLSKTKQASNSNGTIKVLTASKGSGRSISATDVYFDEMPHAQYSDEIYTSSYPTISRTKGRFTVFSTPNGRGNLFYEICKNHKEMGYSHHQYEWWFVPDYNPYYAEFMAAFFKKDVREQKRWIEKAREGNWYKATLAAMGDLRFMQEYECNFDAGEDQVFTTKQLANVFKKNWLERDYDAYGELWKDARGRIPGHDYFTATDYGRKRDPLVSVTFDITEYPARVVELRRITPANFDFDNVTEALNTSNEYWKADAVHDGTGNGDVLTALIGEWSAPRIIGDSGLSKIKTNMVVNLRRACDTKAIMMPNIPWAFKQFDEYRYNDKKLVQDFVMAVAMAVREFYDPEMGHEQVDRSFNYMGQNA